MLVLADSSLPEPYWEKAIFLGYNLRGIMVPNSTKDGGWYYHVSSITRGRQRRITLNGGVLWSNI